MQRTEDIYTAYWTYMRNALDIYAQYVRNILFNRQSPLVVLQTASGNI